jgi:hypothetical protein
VIAATVAAAVALAAPNPVQTRTIAIGKPTLVNASRPTVRGAPKVGRFVECKRGSWTGTEPIVFAYSWLRGGAAIRVQATNGPKTVVAVSRSVRVR